MSVCVLGSINLDVVASVETLPRPGETITAGSVRHFPGGKGANQAVAAARMGAPTRLIGAVGTDAAADELCAFLQGAGVDLSSVVRKPDHATGQAFINVASSGENAIVVAPGANRALSPNDIDLGGLAGWRVFLAQLETELASIEAVFSSAPARQACRILNAAPARPAAAELFPLADVLIVNETELASYAGLSEVPAAIEAVVAAARKLLCRDGQTVLVTLGAQGVVMVDAAEDCLIGGRHTQAVDTTGAGDCFCGALAAALSEGQPLADALQTANCAASLSVERPGAASSMPLRSEVQAVVASLS